MGYGGGEAHELVLLKAEVEEERGERVRYKEFMRGGKR